MKQFACGAVVPNCAAVFHAENEADILEQVAQHAKEDHGMTDLPPEVLSQVRANIKDA